MSLIKLLIQVGNHAPIHLLVNETVILILTSNVNVILEMKSSLFIKRIGFETSWQSLFRLGKNYFLPRLLLTTFVIVPLSCLHFHMSNPKLQFVHQNS